MKKHNTLNSTSKRKLTINFSVNVQGFQNRPTAVEASAGDTRFTACYFVWYLKYQYLPFFLHSRLSEPLSYGA